MQGIAPIGQVAPTATKPVEAEPAAAVKAPTPADTNAFNSVVSHANFEGIGATTPATTTATPGTDPSMNGGVVDGTASNNSPGYWERGSGGGSGRQGGGGGGRDGQEQADTSGWDSVSGVGNKSRTGTATYGTAVPARTPQAPNRILSDISSRLNAVQEGLRKVGEGMHGAGPASASGATAGGKEAGAAKDKTGNPGFSDMLSRYEEAANFNIQANVLVTSTNGATHSFNSLLKGQ